MEAMRYPRMENLVNAASDRRRLFRTGEPSPGPINPIVFGYGRPRRRRMHWIIAFVLVAGMGAISLAGQFLEPDNTQPRLEAVTGEARDLLRGP